MCSEAPTLTFLRLDPAFDMTLTVYRSQIGQRSLYPAPSLWGSNCFHLKSTVLSALQVSKVSPSVLPITLYPIIVHNNVLVQRAIESSISGLTIPL